MHEAPLTQKSLALKFALTLEPDVKSVWGNVLPLRENPVHVDSYWRAMVNVTIPLVFCCINCSFGERLRKVITCTLTVPFQSKAIVHHVNALV